MDVPELSFNYFIWQLNLGDIWDWKGNETINLEHFSQQLFFITLQLSNVDFFFRKSCLLP